MGIHAQLLEDHKWVHIASDERSKASIRRTWFEIGFGFGVFSLLGVEATIYLIWWFHHLH